MKIKRFTAKNMREAIRLVREEQGPDAVILSNRRVADGIEVVSATDYDSALIQQALRPESVAVTMPAVVEAAPAVPPPLRQAPRLPEIIPPVATVTPVVAAPEPAPVTVMPAIAVDIPPVPPMPAQTVVTVTPKKAARNDDGYEELKRELASMRSLLRDQLSGLAWDQLRTKQPRRAAVLRALIQLSIAPSLAHEIIAELPHDATDDHARYMPLGALARRIPVSKPDEMMDGGVYAMVGATGVGKTTTIAKLAARFAARHGTRDLALVTTDTYRIGAQEQLHTYGRLLGVPVHTAGSPEQLAYLLHKLSDRRMILIDTAGLAPRDAKLGAQLEALAKAGNVKNYLVLPASSQAGDLDQAVLRFGAKTLHGCIITKLDEATRLGGALSTVIRRNLPVAYCCDGQRVPEDLHLARPYNLVVRAQQLAQQTPANVDDDALALQFGAAHAA